MICEKCGIGFKVKERIELVFGPDSDGATNDQMKTERRYFCTFDCLINWVDMAEGKR